MGVGAAAAGPTNCDCAAFPNHGLQLPASLKPLGSRCTILDPLVFTRHACRGGDDECCSPLAHNLRCAFTQTTLMRMNAVEALGGKVQHRAGGTPAVEEEGGSSSVECVWLRTTSRVGAWH